MQSTTRTRSRLTPTMAVILGTLLVLLTASGCQTPSLTTREASVHPPMEETADADAPAPRVSTQAVSTPTPTPRPKSATARASSTAHADRVVWTTAEPGHKRPAPPEPRTPVAMTTGPAPIPAPTPAHAGPGQTSATPRDRRGNGHPTKDAESEPATLPLFYVFGEVEHPGPYHHTGRNRVFDVIAQVKPNRRANPAKVQLIRPAKDGGDEANVFLINVDRMVRTGEMSHNRRLEAGDILYVPPTGGAKLGLALGSLLGLTPKPDTPDKHQ